MVNLDEECKGPKSCPDAKVVSCMECGHTWEPADLSRPGKCPECECRRYIREFCPTCPRHYIEQHGATVEMELLRRAIEWENALSQECRFHVTLAEIPADEFAALQILRREQSQHLKEKHR